MTREVHFYGIGTEMESGLEDQLLAVSDRDLDDTIPSTAYRPPDIASPTSSNPLIHGLVHPPSEDIEVPESSTGPTLPTLADNEGSDDHGYTRSPSKTLEPDESLDATVEEQSLTTSPMPLFPWKF